MKAMKVILASYDITVQNEKGKSEVIPYEVRKSLADILLAPQLRLNGSRLLRNSEIAEKILKASQDFILLDLQEHAILKEATEDLELFSKNDVELIKRVRDAEKVEVEETKGGE